MSTQTLLSVEVYLASSYEPDCDYVDGQLEERNVGTRKHSRLQGRIVTYLLNRYAAGGIEVFPEMRVQVSPSRFRIPDVCVTVGDPNEEVFHTPPFLCIEILSPEDRVGRLEARIQDYLDMGVPFVWVIDPESRQSYVATAAEGFHEVKSGVLRTENPVLEVPLATVLENES